MPAGGSGGARPPWLKDDKDGGEPPPKKNWTPRKRLSVPAAEPERDPVAAVERQLASAKASLKKQKAPKAATDSENGVDTGDDDRPSVKPSAVKKAETDTERLPPKKPPLPKQPSKDEAAPRRPSVLQRQSSKEDGSVKKWRDPLLEKVKENIDKTIANEIPKGHTLTKNESLRSLLKPVPPPLPPPMPPKLPPPPDFKKSTVTSEKLKKIESLKSRPRRRPDWSDMMKEVEAGRKLKHVVCDDRSSPVITKSNMVKAKGQYVYESEKGNMHNQLLKQINLGVKLKSVKTNDRSRPNLDGLRKFRRQMTVEEQIQKSQSQANLSEVKEAPPEEEEIDEMDDIDKVRDDLQSTKQLLALELRNKEAQQRENKRLLARIANLEAELKSERAHVKQEQAKTVISVVDAYDETLVASLKREVTETKRVADDLEKKYHAAAEELDEVRSDLEEARRKNSELEKKLEQAAKGRPDDDDDDDDRDDREPRSYFLVGSQGIPPGSGQTSRRPSHAQRQHSIREPSTEEEPEESSGDEGEDDEDKERRRLQREIKTLGIKVKGLADKKDKARKERAALKEQLGAQQAALRQERKKYKLLKKEVDKMASLMKDTAGDEDGDGDDDDDDDEDGEDGAEPEKPAPPDSEDEETESDPEEETESDTDTETEPEESRPDERKEFLLARVKKLETAVSALKKGNYLIIANVDRLKDDVVKQREESASLQEDLDSVLAELE